MRHTPEDLIKYILEKDPDIKQAFSNRKLADVFSDPDFKPGDVKIVRKYYDVDGEIVNFAITEYYKDVYFFEYDKGYSLYIDVDVLDAWQRDQKLNEILEDLVL